MHSDARRIRSLNEECRKLKDHGSRLESLVAAKELLERETLSKQLLDYSNKLLEHEKILAVN